MKLLIIRHGESEVDILNVCKGRADFELTECGHRQAIAIGDYVSQNYQMSKIYHSTLKRAVQTANHLATKTQAQLIPDEHLMEFNNGLLAGLKHSIAEEKYPKVNVPAHLSVYEQESMLEFRYIAEYVLSKLISGNNDNSTVAVVTHGGMINQLYSVFFGLPVETQFSFRTGDTGMHEWIINENQRVLVRANYIPHNV